MFSSDTHRHSLEEANIWAILNPLCLTSVDDYTVEVILRILGSEITVLEIMQVNVV